MLRNHTSRVVVVGLLTAAAMAALATASDRSLGRAEARPHASVRLPRATPPSAPSDRLTGGARAYPAGQQEPNDSIAWRSLFDGKTLAGWEETAFGGQGLIRVKDGAMVLEFGEPLTGVTYAGEAPRIDYELRLEARRLAGSDFFCGLTFPVVGSHASLILGGWGGALVGISNIDGQDASGNETTQYVRFEDERWYGVRVRVTSERLQAWLDETSIVDVSIAGREIDVRPEMLLSRPLGIASYRTRAAIRRIEVRTLER